MDAERDAFPEVDIQGIGRETVTMLEDAMAAYGAEDTEACYDIAERDDAVDRKCERASELVVRDLIEREDVEGDEQAEQLMQDVYRLLLTIRDLERVGDHGVNIAARSLYMVENDDDLLY
jgi:phosphate transport system protein